MAKLGDIATYINGYAFKPSDWSTEGLPIIRIQDLTGSSYKTNKYNGDYDKKYEVNNGDILISWSASLGVFVWKNDRAVLNQHIFKVIFNKKVVDKDFFVYQVENILRKAQNSVHGATMKHLTKPVFDSLDFYLPLIEEQKRIAKQLKLINLLIDRRNDQIKKLDLLVKSRFIEMFGEPIKNSKGLPLIRLGDYCYLKAGVTTPADTIHEYSKEYNVPCYGGNGIRGYVKEATQSGEYPIIGRQGALCGNVKLATGIFHATEHAVLVKALRPANTVWLYFMLMFMDLYRFHTGAAQPGLAVKTLNTILVPEADVNLQNQFADFVAQVDKSKFVVTAKFQ